MHIDSGVGESGKISNKPRRNPVVEAVASLRIATYAAAPAKRKCGEGTAASSSRHTSVHEHVHMALLSCCFASGDWILSKTVNKNWKWTGYFWASSREKARKCVRSSCLRYSYSSFTAVPISWNVFRDCIRAPGLCFQEKKNNNCLKYFLLETFRKWKKIFSRREAGSSFKFSVYGNLFFEIRIVTPWIGTWSVLDQGDFDF